MVGLCGPDARSILGCCRGASCGLAALQRQHSGTLSPALHPLLLPWLPLAASLILWSYRLVQPRAAC